MVNSYKKGTGAGKTSFRSSRFLALKNMTLRTREIIHALSTGLLCTLSALVVAPQAGANTFTLEIDGPTEIQGAVGTDQQVEFFLTLDHQGESPGARAWQFVLEAREAEILDIGIEGTDVEAVIDQNCTEEFPLCYRIREQISGDGHSAAMSVALSQCDSRTLLPNRKYKIARILVETTIGTSRNAMGLSLVPSDHCGLGAADITLVDAKISPNGPTKKFTPGLDRRTLELIPIDNKVSECPSPDRFEPNDSIETATPVFFERRDVWDGGFGEWTIRLDGLSLDCGGDIDYFRFSIPCVPEVTCGPQDYFCDLDARFKGVFTRLEVAAPGVRSLAIFDPRGKRLAGGIGDHFYFDCPETQLDGEFFLGVNVGFDRPEHEVSLYPVEIRFQLADLRSNEGSELRKLACCATEFQPFWCTGSPPEEKQAKGIGESPQPFVRVYGGLEGGEAGGGGGRGDDEGDDEVITAIFGQSFWSPRYVGPVFHKFDTASSRLDIPLLELSHYIFFGIPENVNDFEIVFTGSSSALLTNFSLSLYNSGGDLLGTAIEGGLTDCHNTDNEDIPILDEEFEEIKQLTLGAAELTPGFHVIEILGLNPTAVRPYFALTNVNPLPPMDAPNLRAQTVAQDVELSWTSPVDYESIEIQRDRESIASELAGTTTTFTDAASSAGNHDYTVVGTRNGLRTHSATRSATTYNSTMLTLGVPAVAELVPSQSRVWYTINPDPGARLTIILDGDGGANAVYARWSQTATDSRFDEKADTRDQESQRLVIASARDEALSILVQANVFDGRSNNVTLRVVDDDLTIESSSNQFSGLGGVDTHVTTVVTGAGFDEHTHFSLRLLYEDSSSFTVPASDVVGRGSDKADVLFVIPPDAPAGDYDLVAENISEIAVLEGSFELRTTNQGPLPSVIMTTGSTFIKPRQEGSLLVSYTNLGDVAMVAPIFKIETLSPATDLRLNSNPTFHSDGLQFLGIDRNGLAGTLSPGHAFDLAAIFRSEACDLLCKLDFQLYSFRPGQEDFIPWDLLASPEPSVLPQASWDQIKAPLSTLLGPTWVQFHYSMAQLATRWNRRSDSATAMTNLLALAIRIVDGRATSAAVGRVRDSSTNAPITGATVMAVESGIVKSYAITDGEGSFSIDWLEAGRSYDLVVEGYSVTDSNIDLPALVPVDASDPFGFDEDLLGLELAVVPAAASGLTPACPNCDGEDLPQRSLEMPSELFTPVSQATVTLVSSLDPNEKDGEVGPDLEGRPRIHYTIHFENDPDAPIAADTVTITDPLVLDFFDISTLRLHSILLGDGGDVAESDGRLIVFENFDGYSISCLGSCSPSVEGSTLTFLGGGADSGGAGLPTLLPFDVNVSYEAIFDLEAGEVRWKMDTIGDDPATGFLAPGAQGYVTFTVSPKEELHDEDVIENLARIVFDTNEPVTTKTHRLPVASFRAPREPRNPVPADDPPGDHPTEPDTALCWEPVLYAETYEVRLWPEGHSRPALATAVETVACHHPEGVDFALRYSWEVTAITTFGQTASQTWSFSTRNPTMPPPGTPLPLSPPDGSGVSLTPTLVWHAATNAAAYRVFIWRDGEARPTEPTISSVSLTQYVASSLDSGQTYRWQIVALNGQGETEQPEENVRTFRTGGLQFVRGDVNADGEMDLSDPIFILQALFLGSGGLSCENAADLNNDDTVSLSDAVYSLQYLFRGGVIPDAPHGSCGDDPTPGNLRCYEFSMCGG
jgi:hypothetical protein